MEIEANSLRIVVRLTRRSTNTYVAGSPQLGGQHRYVHNMCVTVYLSRSRVASYRVSRRTTTSTHAPITRSSDHRPIAEGERGTCQSLRDNWCNHLVERKQTSKYGLPLCNNVAAE